jgi:hypothetical protein
MMQGNETGKLTNNKDLAVASFETAACMLMQLGTSRREMHEIVDGLWDAADYGDDDEAILVQGSDGPESSESD